MRIMDEILETECSAEKHDALMTMKANWAESHAPPRRLTNCIAGLLNTS